MFNKAHICLQYSIDIRYALLSFNIAYNSLYRFLSLLAYLSYTMREVMEWI